MEILVKDNLRSAVEAESGGRNTVLYDIKGNPSVMVVVPRFDAEEIDPRLGIGPHPAFIVNGVLKSEILIAKYEASVRGGLAVSMQGANPATRLTFDEALRYCAAKGPGWHLMTNPEWAAVALRCWKNKYLPRGNTYYGRSWENRDETGIIQAGVNPKYPRSDVWTLTGSGPASWNHDGTPYGIADLNGNLFEWVGGLRLVDGEIQVVPHNNAADNTTDQGPRSPAWHAILPNGDLVPPGTGGTLKFDCVAPFTFDNAGAPLLSVEVVHRNDPNLCDDGYASCMYAALTYRPDVPPPWILKQHALCPIEQTLSKEEFGEASLWLRNYGERLPARGGNFYTEHPSGVFALDLNWRRAARQPATGFRPAFVSPAGSA